MAIPLIDLTAILASVIIGTVVTPAAVSIYNSVAPSLGQLTVTIDLTSAALLGAITGLVIQVLLIAVNLNR